MLKSKRKKIEVNFVGWKHFCQSKRKIFFMVFLNSIKEVHFFCLFLSQEKNIHFGHLSISIDIPKYSIMWKMHLRDDWILATIALSIESQKIKLISKICEGDVKLNDDKNQTKYLRNGLVSRMKCDLWIKKVGNQISHLINSTEWRDLSECY